ncbi:phosphotransferase enzyme family protein [bacterium BMS3Bbin02]|nr:phosphotransferase enzyme family protein [bacterium BMS3Bbin02]
MLHRASRVLLRTVGTAWLPSVPGEEMPLPPDDWSALLASLVAGGIPVDSVAIHGRTQVHRESFSLVTIGREGVTAFVRVADRAALDAESRSIAMLEKFCPASFVYPRTLLRGSAGAVEYAAYSPVLTGFHSPPHSPKIGPVVADIQGALANLPKPAGTPPHWVPIHGDFTPWNLREHRGELVLIDWESCGWGPPHADEVLYIATARVLGLRVPDGVRTDEAAEFWRDRVGGSLRGRDDRLQKAVAKELSITDT